MRTMRTWATQCMSRALLVATLTALVSFVSLRSVLAASPPKPEYYGTYAVVDGKLLGIDVSWSTHTPPKQQVSVLAGLWPARSIAKVDIVELSSGLQFLFYFENTGLVTPMTAASQASLRSMYFKRRKTTWNGNVRPPQLEKTETANYWDVADGNLEILLKPVDGKPQMVLGVPAKPLTAGLYRFSIGKDTLLFSVGSLEAARRTSCFDEAATYVVALWDTKLTPCDQVNPGGQGDRASPSAGQPGSEGARQGAMSTKCNGFDACMRDSIGSINNQDPVSALECATRASELRPSDPRPLNLKAVAHLVLGDFEQAEADLDAAYRIRPTLGWRACLEKQPDRQMLGGLVGGGCQLGSFQISDQKLTFLDENGKAQETWAPSSAKSSVAENAASSGGGTVVPLVLSDGARTYRLHFVPSSIDGCRRSAEYVCPARGLSEQRFVAEYMQKKLRERVR